MKTSRISVIMILSLLQPLIRCSLADVSSDPVHRSPTKNLRQTQDLPATMQTETANSISRGNPNPEKPSAESSHNPNEPQAQRRSANKKDASSASNNDKGYTSDSEDTAEIFDETDKIILSNDESEETPEALQKRKQEELVLLTKPCPALPEPKDLTNADALAQPDGYGMPVERSRRHKDSRTTKIKREIPGIAKSIKLSNESLRLATHGLLFVKAVLALVGIEAFLPFPEVSRMSKAYIKVFIRTCTMLQKVIKTL